MKKYKILFIARDNGGCGFFRCEQPAAFINRAGLAEAKSVLMNPSEEDLLDADLVIMQNSGSPEASSQMNFMLKHNIPFLTEYDDFVFHISPHNTGGYPAWNPGTLFLNRSVTMSQKAVGITVSTNTLAHEFFPYNDFIYVVPNYLDKDKWDIPTSKKIDDKIRIGWAGGNAHADDLKMISKVLQKIVKEYKGKVIFETMGMLPQELKDVFNMDIFNEVCPSCGFEGELHHLPGVPLSDYPTVLASRGWDIALAPVIDNSFGNAKSNLKIMEYSALGIPIVASDIDPYREAKESNSQVYLARTFDEWYNNIKNLIENQSEREKIVKQNKEWVQGFWIQDNIEKIFNVYKGVIERVTPILGPKEYRLQTKQMI